MQKGVVTKFMHIYLRTEWCKDHGVFLVVDVYAILFYIFQSSYLNGKKYKYIYIYFER
jgi:hypothetical protein